MVYLPTNFSGISDFACWDLLPCLYVTPTRKSTSRWSACRVLISAFTSTYTSLNGF